MNKLVAALSAALAGGTMGASTAATAQAFPSKPMMVIVANAPSASYSLALRQMADSVQARTGSTFIFDYVPGGAGTIAPARVKRAEPDGYTIGLIYASIMTLSPLFMKEAQYDPLKDFAYITMLTRHGLLFASRPDFGPNNLQDLIAAAKAKPDSIKFAYVSNATRVSVLQIEAVAGVKFYHVPYKGSPQADAAAMSGEVDFVGSTVANLSGQIKQNRVKPLFIGSRARSPIIPQVQSASELYPNLELVSWFGLNAPAGTPADRINWHNREWIAALKEPKMVALLENNLAVDIVASTPQALSDHIKREWAANAVIVKQYNITE